MTLQTPGRIVVLALLGLATLGCRHTAPTASAPLIRREYTEFHMGVRIRLVVYASEESAAVNACKAAFARIAQIDDAASDYRKNSELMQLCSTASTRPVKLSDDLWTLLDASQRVAKLTDGAFDITAGPLVELWRKSRKFGQLPPAQVIASEMKYVGYEKLSLDPATRSARLAMAKMKLDLGGIAKGYAGDCAIQTLREHGIRSAMCEAGGDIVVSDAPPGKEGWTIAVSEPGPDMPGVYTLANCAISSSGDTEQFVEIAGKHYSHVVDPRTGIGLTHRKMATVIAPTGLVTDPLSTALTIIPAEKIPDVVKQYPGTKVYLRTVKSEKGMVGGRGLRPSTDFAAPPGLAGCSGERVTRVMEFPGTDVPSYFLPPPVGGSVVVGSTVAKGEYLRALGCQ